MSIIQWNINSFNQNRPELECLLHCNPAVICLQETKASTPLQMKGFTSYNVFSRTADDRACGGVSIFVKNFVPQKRIPVVSNIQCVAAQISLHKTFSICCLYIPPSKSFSIDDLQHLYSQLPAPAMLLGDFNAHHLSWGNKRNDLKGIIVDNFISKNSLSLMNDGSNTFFHLGSRSQTAIDLSICHPSLFLNFEWKVNDDLCGSDHFPIFIDSVLPSPEESTPHWILSKANWNKFTEMCEEEITSELFVNEQYPVTVFSDKIVDIASKCIPMSSGNSKFRKRPWFNKECKDDINNRKKAFLKFQNHPSNENLINFKYLKAKARKTVRLSKRQSWQQYVSTLNNQTPMKKVWSMVQKIAGKRNKSTLNMLEKEGETISDPKDIANCLAKSFAKNSSNGNYIPKFQSYQKNIERNAIKFKTKNHHQYNKKLTLKELRLSIKKSKNTSPGPDQIHYQFLKHLPTSCLSILLNILNSIWEDGHFPVEWMEATVIPIAKPGKDPVCENNYRPISLTSCLCKTMERIINDRLVYYLESNNLLDALQSGFRKSRSTTDHLIRLETFIRRSFVKGEHCIGIFFDLEKAYDMTWRYGILKDLFNLGLRGNLPIFIEKFLDNRIFHVRVGSTLSYGVYQEQGVPQGSILSVTLFAIKINSIVKCLTKDIKASLYVDDFQICFSGKNMSTIERQLQLCLNKLDTWSYENGFKFSTSKTVCVHFCRQHKDHPDPKLKLSGKDIPVVSQVKFLGLIFDSKLNFKPHILQLKEKCKKALNLLRVVSHFDWGGDRKVMTQLYKSIILSKLDYGSFIYGSAPKSYIKMLDPIQNEGLRLCLGAYKTSPAESLGVEAGILPLELRREQLALQYVLKLKSNPSNPAYQCIFQPELSEFASKPKTIPTLNLRLQEALDEVNINFDKIALNKLPETPPWTLEPICVFWNLAEHQKNITCPSVYNTEFNRLRGDIFRGHTFIYTDGSKKELKAASAAYHRVTSIRERLPDHASIFSAELNAFLLALDIIEDEFQRKGDFVICSDSQSALQALEGEDFRNPFVLAVRERIQHLSDYPVHISFLWIPSHIGIKGNEQADSLAKNGLLLNQPNDIKLPHSDFKTMIKPYIRNRWQTIWDEQVDKNLKLKEIQPLVDNWKPIMRKSRREEIILARLRIGHTHFTHSFIRKREPPPECVTCGCQYTVEHILLECEDYFDLRRNYINATSMKDLFENTTPDNIIEFVKKAELYKML